MSGKGLFIRFLHHPALVDNWLTLIEFGLGHRRSRRQGQHDGHQGQSFQYPRLAHLLSSSLVRCVLAGISVKLVRYLGVIWKGKGVSISTHFLGPSNSCTILL